MAGLAGDWDHLHNHLIMVGHSCRSGSGTLASNHLVKTKGKIQEDLFQ